MNTPDVSAIIVNLNSRHFLQGCLDSLRNAWWSKFSYEVLVVDNGSTDGSQAMVLQEYPWVRLIAKDTNVGFCPAANQAVLEAGGRYILLLNDDIVIHHDALPRLVEFMEARPDVGMIGSRLLNADGTDQFSSGRTFPTPMNALFGRKSILTKWFPKAPWARNYLLSDRIDNAEPYQVDWLSAAAMLIRRDVYLAVGGLREDFYYFVEILFGENMKRQGHKSYLDPQSKITHFEGVGSGIRTKRVRIRHIVRFHSGAYRWYCLHCGFGKLNPLRAVVGAVISGRAGFLIAVEHLKGENPHVHDQLRAGRPEGGVEI